MFPISCFHDCSPTRVTPHSIHSSIRAKGCITDHHASSRLGFKRDHDSLGFALPDDDGTAVGPAMSPFIPEPPREPLPDLLLSLRGRPPSPMVC